MHSSCCLDWRKPHFNALKHNIDQLTSLATGLSGHPVIYPVGFAPHLAFFRKNGRAFSTALGDNLSNKTYDESSIRVLKGLEPRSAASRNVHAHRASTAYHSGGHR